MKWFLVKLVLATTIQVLSSAWSTFAVTHTRDLHELPWMRVLLVLEYEVGHVEWLTKSGKIKIHQVRKN